MFNLVALRYVQDVGKAGTSMASDIFIGLMCIVYYSSWVVRLVLAKFDIALAGWFQVNSALAPRIYRGILPWYVCLVRQNINIVSQ